MNIKNKIALLALLTGAFFNHNITTSSADDVFVSLIYDIDCEDLDNADVVKESLCSVPVVDNMVPQGLAMVEDLYLVSSYDYTKNSYSCISVIDNQGNIINTCFLNNKAHVGGLAFDEVNSLVWVTGVDGNVNAYDVNHILSSSKASPKYSNMDVGNGLNNYRNPFINSASFLTVYGNELFVGNFSLDDSGKLKRYGISINEDKTLILEYKGFSYIPNCVQGVTFYNHDNKDYIIFSRSFGTEVGSVLQVFNYNENITNYRKCVSVCLELPAMMEQVIVRNSKLVALFESAATPYKNKVSVSEENLVDVEIDDMIKKLELKKDTR